MLVGVEAHLPSRHQREEQILETAYELFSVRGVRDVGVDELVERAGVAKATLYRHFASKDELVLAFLRLREERWTMDWLQESVRERGGTPEEQLFTVFDLCDEWFQRLEYEGCPFIKVLLEMGPAHPVGVACIEHMATIRGFLGELATEAGFSDPDELALSLQLLLCGGVIQATTGKTEAAIRAKTMARAVMEGFRQPAVPS